MPIGHEIIIFTFIWLRTLSTFSLSPCRGPGWTLQLLAMLHTPCSYHTLAQWHLFIHFIAFFPVYPVVVFRPACCKSSNLVIFFESTLKINLIFHPAHCQCSTLPFHHHLCACPPSPSTHNHANSEVITVRSLPVVTHNSSLNSACSVHISSHITNTMVVVQPPA